MRTKKRLNSAKNRGEMQCNQPMYLPAFNVVNDTFHVQRNDGLLPLL